MLPMLLLAGSFAFLPLTDAEQTTESDDASKFCLYYHGTVHFTVEQSDSAPDINLNSNAPCNRVWEFSYSDAGALKLCPPKSGTEESDVRLMDVDFRLQPEKEFPDAVDQFTFINNILVTNDSVSGPFKNGAEPAIFEPNKRSSMRVPQWLIKGTEKSLYKAPETFSGDNTTIACNAAPNPTLKGCTYLQGVNQTGCVLSQTYNWDMQARLNFTVEIADTTGGFKLFSEIEEKNEDGKGIGSYSNVSVSFRGLARSVDFQFVPDDDGMLVLKNWTEDQWYSTGNHTFSSTADGTFSSASTVGVLSVLATVSALLLG